MYKLIVAAMVIVAMASSVSASNIILEANAIQFLSLSNADIVKVKFKGPRKFLFESEYSGGDIYLSLDEINAKKDGVYKYEFIETTVLGDESILDDYNGRGDARRKVIESELISGHFRVKNGEIIRRNLKEAHISIPLDSTADHTR